MEGHTLLNIILNSYCFIFPLKFRAQHRQGAMREGGTSAAPAQRARARQIAEGGRREGCPSAASVLPSLRGFRSFRRRRAQLRVFFRVRRSPTWRSIPALNPPSSSSKGRKRKGEEGVVRSGASGQGVPSSLPSPQLGFRGPPAPEGGEARPCERVGRGKAGPEPLSYLFAFPFGSKKKHKEKKRKKEEDATEQLDIVGELLCRSSVRAREL